MVRPSCIVLFALALTGCWVTDHTERDPQDVTPEVIHIPASGFDDADSDDLPRFGFDSTTIDMGRIAQGAKVTRAYTFTNTGGAALLITDVRGSCGCTVGKEWPRTPVAPGAEGAISVTFDSEGRSGVQNKSVTVTANTQPPTTVLYLKGEVMAPEGN